MTTLNYLAQTPHLASAFALKYARRVASDQAELGEPPATACFIPPDELAEHPYFEPFLLNNFWIDDSITG